ncbi:MULTISPECIES: DUF2808 domain-containing protein [unclassified Coleofasciculus]|uniref:DUF2808 domain-containing protein n=1 Tax=unclassified Coleofasciculus TaxID=2692782 RepID=UPI00187E8CAE|nr:MULTISPECIES: DUF2808 domain-containing protein [unclassified Coleofasciculus]MBE9128494.1 DUF2808 domain-containing protein [Coleofasciculus sp. LEGE 07081]MBE9148686.1 DUF2808 domain-containing protein [Coleofasciculus sp. LEGE 07092]
MISKKFSMGRLFSALAISGCLLTGIAATSFAQSNSGLTIFSGVERENLLRYYLDFGGRANQWDRYRLRIPAKKMELGVSQFVISYPDYYTGKFDPDRIEVRVKGESVPLSEVNWDQENYRIQIYLDEPIQAGNKVEIVLSNVKNPRFGGTFYFNCLILTPGDIPLPRSVGTWILTIS